jgi:hypothetical protein
MPRPRAERAATAARRAKLIQYRRQKRPYAEFYKELGYASEQAASRDFSRALQENLAEQHANIELWREEQIVELEYLAEEAHKEIRAEHFIVSASGKVAIHPDTGEPLRDPGPKLAAIDRAIKVNDRIGKLRGLDRPVTEENAEAAKSMLGALADGIRLYAQLNAQPEEGPRENGEDKGRS